MVLVSHRDGHPATPATGLPSNVSEMTYHVSSGTLNVTHSLTQLQKVAPAILLHNSA